MTIPTPDVLTQAEQIVSDLLHSHDTEEDVRIIALALAEQAQAHTRHLALCVEAQAKSYRERRDLEDHAARQTREIAGLHEAMLVLTEALGAISRMVPCYDAKGTASVQISRIVDVALAHPQVRAWLKESKR